MTEEQLDFEADLDLVIDYLKQKGFQPLAIYAINSELAFVDKKYRAEYIRVLLEKFQDDSLISISDEYSPAQITLGHESINFKGYKESRIEKEKNTPVEPKWYLKQKNWLFLISIFGSLSLIYNFAQSIRQNTLKKQYKKNSK